MEVTKQIMYHVSKEKHWKKGDVIYSGKKENPFWCECKDIDMRVRIGDKEMSIFEMTDKVKSFNADQEVVDFLFKKLKDVSMECSLYIREQVFECVRKLEYPTLPSRQKCLWVADKDQIEYWKTKIKDGNAVILELELEGSMFCGYDDWLAVDTFSSIEYEKRAMHYWSGEIGPSLLKEHLFYGTATVNEIYDFNCVL